MAHKAQTASLTTENTATSAAEAEQVQTTEPVKVEIPPGEPAADWTAAQLEAYALARFDTVKDAKLKLGRKTAVEVWHAGRALIHLRTHLQKTNEWNDWAVKHKKGTINEAIWLAENVKEESQLKGFTITEAKKEFGVISGDVDEHGNKIVKPPSPVHVLDRAARELRDLAERGIEPLRELKKPKDAVANLRMILSNANTLMNAMQKIMKPDVQNLNVPTKTPVELEHVRTSLAATATANAGAQQPQL